jgi:hypothetical protein
MTDASTQTLPAVRCGLLNYDPPTITAIHPAVASEEAEAIDAEEDRCCYVCGKSPCEWLEFGQAALLSLEEKWDFSFAVEMVMFWNTLLESMFLLIMFILPFINYLYTKGLVI